MVCERDREFHLDLGHVAIQAILPLSLGAEGVLWTSGIMTLNALPQAQ